MTEKLKEIFGDRIKENELLSKHLVFRVGGPAKWFATAQSADEIKAAIELCHESKIEYVVLGGGSNIIASDQGYEGLVLKIGIMDSNIEGTNVTVGAGVPSVALARQMADAGLSGLEWMVSLPGTVGGAIRGNAGCFGGEVKDCLKKVTALRSGEIVEIDNKDLRFSYRDSAFKDGDNHDVILMATFELEKDEPLMIKERMHVILDKRKIAQPLASGTAGCTFKNFELPSDKEKMRLEDETEIPTQMLEANCISAGWLIDQLNLKGTKIGGAQISEGHANFILNDGTATADDILQLISLIKTKVRNAYSIQLNEEIQCIGF
ncbi:UDP-N-acetylmuramate dehydrogenase [Candidatus Uhrbacteria bacterium]|jgi:UDP-N-acetylmuramate dehydrogenase|nr:UDP-N-acetylmuramate dehydrogenase [Candidatus Uhrbacteria bacterium]MBT7717664.1 UDP-N-acetylmuramate dehydrogenase [Candidatus Uhrbacteria bacterium]